MWILMCFLINKSAFVGEWTLQISSALELAFQYTVPGVEFIKRQELQTLRNYLFSSDTRINTNWPLSILTYFRENAWRDLIIVTKFTFHFN